MKQDSDQVCDSDQSVDCISHSIDC